MGPAALAQVLRPLALATHPDLVVGLQTSDDAAVYRIAPDLAIVQTVDFFTPIVDDPWTYGAIAAANSMSDVYAMGGTVLFALNVAGFPDDLPAEMISAIFQGAADKVSEAGAIIAGGHTVTDAEPKFGLVVTGTIHPDHVWTKGGARPDDALFLTKPVGTGIVATALKREKARESDVSAATESMLTLNRAAAEAAKAIGGVNAATDITGFGLLGHGSEMAVKSGTRLQIAASAVPLLPGVQDYAAAGYVAGGLGRNRAYFEQEGGGITFDEDVAPVSQTILFDPQTSGGLLFAVDPNFADAFAASFADAELPLWRIGSVQAGTGIQVTP
jgi:selenide, water dikinase